MTNYDFKHLIINVSFCLLQDWSDANKFSTLMADEDNGNESDQ